MLGLGASISPVITNMHNQGSLTLDGTDQYVNIDNLASSFNGNLFSFSGWFKVPTTSASLTMFKIIVGTDTNNQMLCQYHAGGNEIRANHKFGGAADVLNQGSNSIENDGNWHHVVFILDKTGTDKSFLYIDNSLKEEISGTGTLSGSFSKMSIGNNTATGGYYKGNIDECAFWTRAITTAEIAKIYNAGLAAGGGYGIDLVGQMGTNLIGYYRFEEKTGSVAINTANPGTDGTYVNSPSISSVTS
tara:strand:+ start:571 stop:1308 length:738 start_codon:yes stop_codon:yes gene_type:complete